MQTNDWIQLGALLIQTVALVATILIFRTQSRQARAEQREADHKANKARAFQIYQTLEIESNSVFKFEAQFKDIVPEFKTRLGPSIAEFATLAESERDDLLVARKYYENTCNLFEVSARLRAEDIVDHLVFGSWVAWYFDTLLEWGFRAVWADLRDNYTPHLRNIFDPYVDRLIAGWDIPHSQGALPIADGRDVGVDAVEALRVEFYRHVGDLFDCDDVRGWLTEAKKNAPKHAHPLSYA